MDLTLLTILGIIVGFVFFVMPKVSQAEDDLMDELDQISKCVVDIDEKIIEMNNELTRMEKEYVEIKQRQFELVDPGYLSGDIELGV